MHKKLLSLSITAALVGGLAISGSALADSHGKGTFRFKAIDSTINSADFNPAAPWKLPKGFTQRVVTGEQTLNIYTQPTYNDGSSVTPGPQSNDWPDMNTVNETGPQAGRFLYTTHEVRGNTERGGTVTVTDLKTGKTTIIAEDPGFDALDGIRWTPWGSILFAEEKEGGRLFEIKLDPNDLTKALEVVDRPAVGRVAHEGIEVDKEGNVYVVDEFRGQSQGCGFTPCGGGIYKFVPTHPGNADSLSDGQLFVLRVNGPDGVGQGEWVGPIDPSNARVAGSLAPFNGTSYQRPEDLEIIGDTLYANITEGPRAQGLNKEVYESRVISINLKTMQVANFVKPGVNVPVEIGRPGDANFQTGMDNVDNLAESPDGRLVIVEDNVPSDIWFASTKTNEFGASEKVELFGSLSDPSAEGTGIYFSPLDPKTLYVNVQHSAIDDGDATWAISKTGNNRGHGHIRDRDDK